MAARRLPDGLDKLRRALPAYADLFIGDVADTVPQVLATVSAERPIGFVVFDVDYYSSARSALGIFRSTPDKYLPAALVYLDDIVHICSNQWAGKLLAVSEFNSETLLRKIAPYTLLRSLRTFKNPQ
jgi:hypothetical protein